MVCTYFRTISSRRLSRLFRAVGLVAVSPSISIDRGARASRVGGSGPTYPFEAATSRVSSVQGQPFSRNHLSTSRWPPTAYAHVDVPTGSRSRAHFSTSSWPYSAARARPRSTGSRSRATTSAPRAAPFAANAHVDVPHGQPFARAHFSTSRCNPSPRTRTCTRPTGSRSRAPTSTSRGPPFAAFRTFLAPLAAVLARPQHLEVAALAALVHV